VTKLVPLSGLVAALLVPLVFAPAAQAAEKVRVVASFSILADLVHRIGGERVAVSAFVGPNTDMHVFQPAPGAAKELLDANLVVINGLGFEGWADRLVKASGYKGPLVIASNGITARKAGDDHSHGKGHGHGHGHGHSHGKKGHSHAHGPNDPHAWQDPANVKVYVANIRDALIAADPAGKAQYEAAATAYLAELDKLDAEIRAAFAPIGEKQRRVITSHDAFGYFGAAYKVRFLAPQGVGGDSEPTAKGVAALIRQIKRNNIRAVFVESISNPRLIQQIAKETGVKLGGTLYSDALSAADGPAGNYLAMMRHNKKLLAEAMQDGGS
jgi:zinc/manganese transport system substrate-binding protein